MSGLFKLNFNDLFKGFIVAALAAIGTILVPMLDAGTLPTLAQLGTAGAAGLTAGLAYLVKNLFTNSDGQIAKPEGR
jgi:histidine ammonia-lyase